MGCMAKSSAFGRLPLVNVSMLSFPLFSLTVFSILYFRPSRLAGKAEVATTTPTAVI
jgi:hypothetical protein